MINWQDFTAKLPLLFEKLFEQVYLTLGALFIAMIISIPVGIMIARREKPRQYILGLSSVMQTLPSLAVLGFLIPFLGIGVKTAIVTLVLYAMLPIMRNTVTGLLGIPHELLESADGLGLTKFQKMRLVELPLALPVIVAGIRTATAMSVGIATIAAFIGAGGLGDFIYEGLSLSNMQLILWGAIPAALLALLLDYLIARIENVLTMKKKQRKRISPVTFALIAFVSFFFLLPFFTLFLHGKNKNSIVIGTKNFSEQLILGELLTQTIEQKTKLKVVKKFNLGGTFVCHQAMLNGQIDLYPEYTGTAYMVILKQSAFSSPQQVYDYVKTVYPAKFDIYWLNVFGFDNSNAVAVRKEFSEKNKLITISDLTALAPRLSIGVPADFLQRPDGFVGLKQKYQLHFGDVRLMDPGLMYQAIEAKQLDAIMAFSTDGRLPAYHLITLQDDKHLFPPYYAAPVIRGDVLKKYPEVVSALSILFSNINNNTMQQLNYQVDVLKQAPKDVAHNFLIQLYAKKAD